MKQQKYDRIAIFSHSAAISNLKAYLTNEKYESIRMCCLLYRNNQLNVLGTVSSKTNDVLLHIGEINEV